MSTGPGAEGSGTWISSTVSEELALRSWQRLARLTCSQWNIVGVDLFTQPYKASWGAGDLNSDWNRAAERIGNHVLSLCPRWLVFVQGVGSLPGAGRITAEGSGDENLVDLGFFWGENLVGARKHPVTLSDPSRLVYAPATFGPSTYAFPFYKYGKFPANMPYVWGLKFGFVQDELHAPLAFAQIGDAYDTQLSKTWLQVRACRLSTLISGLVPARP